MHFNLFFISLIAVSDVRLLNRHSNRRFVILL